MLEMIITEEPHACFRCVPDHKSRTSRVEPSYSLLSQGVFDDGDGKVPKPPGSVGRPNSGGYTLTVALNWTKPEYNKLRVGGRTLSFSMNTNNCLIGFG